jgi:hypothetical protein
MTDTLTWEGLPAKVHDTVRAQFGPVKETETTTRLGRAAGARLHLEDGSTIFVKAHWAHSGVGRESHRRELWAATALPPGIPAPALLWSGTAVGWLLAAYEDAHGRPADLSRTSGDVGPVLDTIITLGHLLTPCPDPDPVLLRENLALLREQGDHVLDTAALGAGERHMYRAALTAFDPAAVEGDTLLHFRPHPGHFLITASGPQVVGWGRACRGAAWVEAALLGPHLIAAGYSPVEAETWLAWIPPWRTAPPDAVTALIAVWALSRAYRAEHGPHDHRQTHRAHADAGRAWLAFRSEYA